MVLFFFGGQGSAMPLLVSLAGIELKVSNSTVTWVDLIKQPGTPFFSCVLRVWAERAKSKDTT